LTFQSSTSSILISEPSSTPPMPKLMLMVQYGIFYPRCDLNGDELYNALFLPLHT
jgi:hypothetical protein